MFKYNTLSDLIDSDELVTPIKKEGDRILCINSNNEEVYHSFEEFDFDKMPSERVQDVIIEVEETDPEPELEPEQEKNKIVIIEDLQLESNIVVSAGYLKVKKLERKKEKDYFVTDNTEKRNILKASGYKYSKLRNVNIYVEEVDLQS